MLISNTTWLKLLRRTSISINYVLRLKFQTFLKFLLCSLLVVAIISIITDFSRDTPKTTFKEFQRSKKRLIDIDRLKRLSEKCKKHRLNYNTIYDLYNDQLKSIYVDDINKFLYCAVPRTASNVWKSLMKKMSGRVNETGLYEENYELKSVKRLGDYRYVDKERILKQYTKFLVVRDPYERILSLFRKKYENKFDVDPNFRNKYDRTIVENFRKNVTLVEIYTKVQHDVKFPEFVEFITWANTVPRLKNDFWTPVNQICHPCVIHYDIIGKYETIKADSDWVLKLIEVDFLKFPTFHRHIEDGSKRTSELVDDYFGKLPIHVLSNFYKMYRADFKLFAYKKRFAV